MQGIRCESERLRISVVCLLASAEMPPSLEAAWPAYLPHQPTGSPPSGRAHLPWWQQTATLGWQLAKNGTGGRSLPALAQVARARCRLSRGAATQRWSLLANNFRGGLFYHFIGAGSLMCQKFLPRRSTMIFSAEKGESKCTMKGQGYPPMAAGRRIRI
jgi:hypothetical protein